MKFTDFEGNLKLFALFASSRVYSGVGSGLLEGRVCGSKEFYPLAACEFQRSKRAFPVTGSTKSKVCSGLRVVLESDNCDLPGSVYSLTIGDLGSAWDCPPRRPCKTGSRLGLHNE